MAVNNFVVTKSKVSISGKQVLDKDEVGIIKSEKGDKASVFFIRLWKEVELKRSEFEVLDPLKTGDAYEKKFATSATSFYPPPNFREIKTV